jgi:membrane fusion protein (multidrug efflux system)
MDIATANVEQKQAEVDEAKAKYQQTVVKAPFTGRLGLRLINLGDIVSPSQNIVRLQNLDTMRIDFNIPENFLGKLAIGQAVNIKHAGFTNEKFQGTVYAFDSAINPETRIVAVRAKLNNSDNKLFPGAFVEVTLLAGKPIQAISVPQTAILSDIDGNYVYKVVNNKAKKQHVTLLRREQDIAILSDGLASDEEIITTGQLKLQPGSTIINVSHKGASRN